MRRFNKLQACTRLATAMAVLLVTAPAFAADGPPLVSAQGEFMTAKAAAFGVTQPIRDQVPVRRIVKENESQAKEQNENARIKYRKPGAGAGDGAFLDPLLANNNARGPSTIGAPTTFLGQTGAESLCGCLPPDTNGDVGPNHYVQTVNISVSVYDKTTGGRQIGPVLQSAQFFQGLPAGDACRTGDDGDPVVLYDPLADRWMISQFEVDGVPGRQCIAISRTPDPLGAYYSYAFVMPNNNFFDYPHYGVWPDGYYLTVNQFNQAGTAFTGAGIFAFDRAKMLVGDPTASYIYRDVFGIDPNAGGQLPTDIDGVIPPPTGLPNRILEFRANDFGDPIDGIRTYELVPNYATPASSTFNVRADTPLAEFDARAPSGRNLIEQGAGTALDAISDRLLFRVGYRNLGTPAAPINSWVGNFTVNVSGVNPTSAATYQTGVRWFELRSTDLSNPPMTVRDQGTQNLAPGNGAGINNWMGSIAQDGQGNLGLGYSQAPQPTPFGANIVVTGRTGAATGVGMNEGETVFVATGGAQSSSSGRWGDYSSMSVDPNDECTFWYTQEYYTAASSAGWATRFGKFILPGCTAPQRGQIAANLTICSSGLPLAGAVVTLPGGLLRTTKADGTLDSNFKLPPGTYTATASKPTFGSITSSPLTVTNNGTVTFTGCLTGVPTLSAGTPVTLVSESFTPPNGAPDPGEVVTLSLPVVNNGGADSSAALVGTLAASGNVTLPGAPQTYGVVVAGGPTVSRDFAFTVGGTCGQFVTPTLGLQDGPTAFPAVAYAPIRIGVAQVNTALSQNFDGAAAPALPAGWTSAVTGATPLALWTTSATTPSSAPNAAFVNEVGTVSTSELVSEAFTVPAGGASVTFKNLFNYEDTYDGMVLEISIGAGAFTDIVTAGGTFTAGGYTDTISTGFSSPIGGRQAWSGLSGGTTAAPAYITSTVTLPAAANGQSVRLRWLAATDSSVVAGGVPGIRIDDVVVSATTFVCAGGLPDALFSNGFE